KDRLLRSLAGGNRVQLFRQLDVVLVRSDLEAGVREFLELGGNGRLHFGMQMARVEDGNARPEIDVPRALNVPQFRVRGPVRVDGERVRDPSGNGFLAALVQVGIRFGQGGSP